MSSFEEREKAHENKFAHDEALRFKAEARRNKLLGLWAAEKMGLNSDEIEDYVQSVILADFEEAGDEDVFRKIRSDFDARGVNLTDHQIRRTMQELMETAREQVHKET